MNQVAIVAGGEAKAGRRAASWRELVQEAGKALFEDVNNLAPKDVDSLFVGAAQPERFAFQSYVAPLVAEHLGIIPRKVIARTELACVSGQAAIRYAWNCVASGMSDIAVAIGVEKMYQPDMAEAQTTMTCVLDREWDGINCFSAPPIFAVTAQRHMYEFGTTQEQMALVSVKNHHYSSLNPIAHLRKEVTIEDVLKSPVVAPPLHLFDCCPMTDGSAGIILVRAEEAKKYTDTPMHLIGSGQCAIGNAVNNLASLTDWVPLRRAAEEAWRTAKISKDDVDIAEVHDCFTISEIMEYEGLGFCEKGRGGKFIEDGEPYIGGKVAVNPSGGIMGCGHPLGATSIYHTFELLKQFRGDVDQGRYVKGAEIGIQHSLSGAANQHSILVCSREPR
ncbi:MAG: 3-ketoacyl-CoA thiolase [Candidatus Bathyarchaeota archaeon]|nr:MAG: 3-ketoacyl-CoA thiolase [Candidatus Bathyarchaeota archaeon]